MDELRRDWDLLRQALGLTTLGGAGLSLLIAAYLMTLGAGLALLIAAYLIGRALWSGGTALARWAGWKT